jgi:hypothetical protein
MSTAIQLKRIQDKLNVLLKRYAEVELENARLKESLKLAKDRNSLQEEGIEKMKQQLEIMKYSSAEMDDAEKKEFEKRINTYLKEIDRCIVMLGQ